MTTPNNATDELVRAAKRFLEWIDFDFPSGVRHQEKTARERLRRALEAFDPSPEPTASIQAQGGPAYTTATQQKTAV